MYKLTEIEQLHVEITTRCNAACPMCPRNLSGGKQNPNLPMAELSLQDVRQIFPEAFLKQLKFIFLCGVYGDAMVARDTLEVFEYFRRTNPGVRLGMHTNGSGRTVQWWTKLASLVDYCQFGIDGLADTNHLYRRRTDWQKVMSSAEAFIAAGGYAQWEFIVFRHNEHQIDTARKLSETMGFKQFRVCRTSRFVKRGVARRLVPVLRDNEEIEYYLEPPTDQDLLNPEALELANVVAGGITYSDYLDATGISCEAVAEKKLFVSAEGLVFPCCYTAEIYPSFIPPQEHAIMRALLPYGGKAAIDAKLRPLEEIVEGPFFQKALPESWNLKSIAEGKLAVCASTCGKCKSVKAQYGSNLIQLQPRRQAIRERWARVRSRLTGARS